MNFLKGLARAFTVPAKVRKELDTNPTVQIAKAFVLPKAVQALAGVVDQHVNDPETNALLKQALQIGIEHALGIKADS